MDNLTTHGIGSLYEAFAPARAVALPQPLAIHPTPKPRSWLTSGAARHVGLACAGVVDDLPAVDVLGGQLGGLLQHRRLDGEVAGGDHADALTAGEPVQFGVVLRGQPIGADDRVHTGLHGAP